MNNLDKTDHPDIPPRLVRTPIRKHYRRLSQESDRSDASTSTIGITITYEHIQLSREGTESEHDSEGVESIYQEELDRPIWHWTDDFEINTLFEEQEEEPTEQDFDMSLSPPTFSGYTPAESVNRFIDDIQLYIAARGLNAAQHGGIIVAALRGPAKTQFNAAIAAGAANGGLAAPPTNAASIALCYIWLRTRYHTVEIQ